MTRYRCKHFIIQELVGPDVFTARGERAWELLDAGMLQMLDRLRDKFGTCVINNWHKGGSFKESGLRDFGTSTGAKYSMHKFGGGFDLKFGQHTAKEVFDYVLAHPDEFPFITAMENVLATKTWLHVDGRNHNQQSQIWVVNP